MELPQLCRLSVRAQAKRDHEGRSPCGEDICGVSHGLEHMELAPNSFLSVLFVLKVEKGEWDTKAKCPLEDPQNERQPLLASISKVLEFCLCSSVMLPGVE